MANFDEVDLQQSKKRANVINVNAIRISNMFAETKCM